jgi:hypothetical protein
MVRRMMMRRILWVALAELAAVPWAASPAGAQGEATPAAADSARAACVAAVRSKREAEAQAAAKEAERLYRRLIDARPADPEPRVKLAQVLSLCRIPYASFTNQGRLVGQSNQLLEEALVLAPTHWGARYTLAMNHHGTPEFLGRTDDAIREFERLLVQQGERADFPEQADPYVYLGDLYERKKRPADALALWQRGARLFPNDARLRQRLERAAVQPPLPSPPADTTPAGNSPPTAAFVLAPLVVEASAYRLDDAKGGAALSSMDVFTTPGGTADVLQVFQTLPGVNRGSEGSDLYVRGGDPAESPVFVDGARLFYAGTFESLHGGLFGVLDPAVLRRAYFSSGGFSARYGNALSGVLDLETEGRPTARSWRAGLNLVGAGATLRTPLGERAGVWGSVRGTHTSLLLRTHGESGDYPRAPRSVEGMVGLAAAPTRNLELRAVALAEGDRSTRTVDFGGYEGPFQSEGNTRLALLSSKLVRPDGGAALGLTASATERISALSFGVLDRERTDRGLALRLDGDLARGPVRLRAGLEASTAEGSVAGMVPLTDQLAPGSPARPLDEPAGESRHAGAFLESEFALGGRLALVAGVRGDRLPGEAVWTGDPRLALSLRAGEEWVFRLGGGIFHQGRRRVQYRTPDEGAPGGVPRRARHLATSLERTGEPSLRVEGYFKDYDRYVPKGEGPQVVAGSAAGLDAVARWWEGRRLTGWLAYSYLHGRIELADGRRVPSAADVTHTLTAVGKAAFGPWEVGSTFRFGTGRPYTPIVGAAQIAPGRYEPIHGAIHGERLPDYQRLDARLTRFTRIPPGLMVLYLEMLNLLDRSNAFGYTYSASYAERRPITTFFADRTLVLGMELRF